MRDVDGAHATAAEPTVDFIPADLSAWVQHLRSRTAQGPPPNKEKRPRKLPRASNIQPTRLGCQFRDGRTVNPALRGSNAVHSRNSMWIAMDEDLAKRETRAIAFVVGSTGSQFGPNFGPVCSSCSVPESAQSIHPPERSRTSVQERLFVRVLAAG